MKIPDYPMPCDKCEKNTHERCNYRTCSPWLTRYFYRQKQINAYAKKVLPQYYESVKRLEVKNG